MELKQLDIPTRSKLRSTQILSSIPQIISELVQNSLDAGASQIGVGVNCEEWSCWVTDDGSGIRKEDLSAIAGGPDGRYATSKAYNPSSLDHVSTFGFRGEALASAADLSLLEISSRTARSKESWSVIIKGSERIYYGPSVRWRRERPGTTVSVRDIFYNLPVRRLSHPNSARTLDIVRRDIEAIALVFHSVAFSVEDSVKEHREGSGKGRVLTVPKTQSSLNTFRHLYGRAMVDHVEELNEHRGHLGLMGFVSLVGAHSRTYQFLYLNNHLLDNCDLHKVIDQQFSISTFAKHALDELGIVETPRPGTRRSPRKGERRPVYVLNLLVPPKEIDNCLEPAKAAVHLQNQGAVISFLADVIQAFLVRNNFKSTPSVTTDEMNPFDKRKRSDSSDVDRECDDDISTYFDKDSRKLAKDIYIRGSLDAYDLAEFDAEEAKEMAWTDPASGQMYRVDPRTGNSYVWTGKDGAEDENAVRDRLASRRTLRKRQKQDDESGRTEEMPEWIRDALQSNSAYGITERQIKNAHVLQSSGTFGTDSQSRDRPAKTWTGRGNQPFSNPVLQEPDDIQCSTPFTKECLSNVRIIQQIDRKFIACLIPTTEHKECEVATLVLVDQHAADERIRVERFLRELCVGFLDRDGAGVKRRTADPPLAILLTKQERERLLSSARTRKAFADWGFDMRSDLGEEAMEYESDYGVVQFSAVPELVADKLFAGDDLRELVKGYLSRLEIEGLMYDESLPAKFYHDGDQLAWLKALRYCPRELVELVNSKACRGAIMFNDTLSMDQCRRLMRQLAKTAFPFQCAHGRPSIVPLTKLNALPGATKNYTSPSRTLDWSRLYSGDSTSSDDAN